MPLRVQRCAYEDVAVLRQLYRRDANCQIVHDSFLCRRLADAYLIYNRGKLAGYGGVSNRYDKGRLVEFYVLPECERLALPLFRELLRASQAIQLEAQTNMPLMLQMLLDCGSGITVEKILFEDAFPTDIRCPNAEFKPGGNDGEWMVEREGQVVATGGFLTHYNPPYADIYMEVKESARRQGFGSYLVQEIKRACYAAGKKPAARCNPENIASRRTLEKAGFRVCGHVLVAGIVPLR